MSQDRPRGRGPSITQEMKKVIRDIHMEHPDWPAKSFIEPLTEAFGWSPEERAIQIVRKKGMDNLKDRSVFRLLQPWSLSNFDDYNIPSEAVPYILKVQQWNKKMHKGSAIFTNWQAKWVSRLYSIKKNPHFLWKVSLMYAMYELGCTFANTKPNTSQLDDFLLSSNWDELFTEWAKEYSPVERSDPFLWLTKPQIFYGEKTWEELEQIYSKSEVQNERTHNQKRQR